MVRKFREGQLSMCTCITYKNKGFYFGRNMDLEYSFGECVIVTPRTFPLRFTHIEEQPVHYAMVGMAAGQEGTAHHAGTQAVGRGRQLFPLYAEAVNEKGLCMAGLNFPGNAYYRKAETGRTNVASFELIPWVLGTCASAAEAEAKLRDINITDDAFSKAMPPAQLHWMLADRDRCLVIESVRERVKLYENPIGILTNNPPFEYHRMNINNYLNVTAGYPKSRFCRAENAGRGKTGSGKSFPRALPSYLLNLEPYSQGMGGIGLPGDYSSVSRFVRAAFLKCNSVCEPNEEENVSQFFHMLDSVAMPRGAVITQDGKYDITTYSCCVNADTGTYYYKTYGNSQINAVDMRRVNLDGNTLSTYPMETGQIIRKVN